MGCALLALAQTSGRHTLSGYVTDAASGETLIGATVWAESVSQGVASNVYGFYTLTLPADVYEVRASVIPSNAKWKCGNGRVARVLRASTGPATGIR